MTYGSKELKRQAMPLHVLDNIENPISQALLGIKRIMLARRETGEAPPPEPIAPEPIAPEPIAPEPIAPEPKQAALERLRIVGWPPAILDNLATMNRAALRLAREIQASQAAGQMVHVISGPPGSGKTSVAALAATLRLKAGGKIGAYQTAYQFAQEIHSINRPEAVAKSQAAAQRVSWLVLDDIGRAPAWATDEIAATVVHRHGHYLPTILIGAPGAVKRLDAQIKVRAEITEIPWQR